MLTDHKLMAMYYEFSFEEEHCNKEGASEADAPNNHLEKVRRKIYRYDIRIAQCGIHAYRQGSTPHCRKGFKDAEIL